MARVRVSNIVLPFEEAESGLRTAAARMLGVPHSDLGEIHIRRRALDARRATRLRYVYTVDVEAPISAEVAGHIPNVTVPPLQPPYTACPGDRPLRERPVVIGAGPAGLFAAWRLAESGYRPLLLERGKPVEQRRIDTAAFWKRGDLDPDSNVLFGEGGAGTFSDGKLTSRSKDHRKDEVLQILVECGAPESIRYDARPHLGTNRLPRILREIRGRLIAMGVDIQFDVRLDDFLLDQGVTSVVTNSGRIEANAVVLAVGHSARDTYAMLHERVVRMEPKPFAIGIRVQHEQSLIDRAQYGRAAGNAKLDPAEYVLRCANTRAGRSVYSFCMCPGGSVISCASEPGMLSCNGMSGGSRSGSYANGAVVAEVQVDDFPVPGPLGGVELQRMWESRTFEATGGTYALPVMALDDLVRDTFTRVDRSALALRSFPRADLADLRTLLPTGVVHAIREACGQFDKQIPGWLGSGAAAFGIETRTSAPLRITRDERGESVSTTGLFPAGEGAGYAGGIVSAAIDGLRSAESLIALYARPAP